MNLDRRTLLGGAAALPLAAPVAAAAAPDGDYWETIAREYDVTREVIQLEHGNWGMMARPVLAAYEANVERVNRDTSFYARRTMVKDLERVRATLAQSVGAAPEEMAFSRNATEALKALILQYKRLRPGDAVLYADLDVSTLRTAPCDPTPQEQDLAAVRKIALSLPRLFRKIDRLFSRSDVPGLELRPRVPNRQRRLTPQRLFRKRAYPVHNRLKLYGRRSAERLEQANRQLPVA